VTADFQRPHTLHEVARLVAVGERPFDHAVREFLDFFYQWPDRRAAALDEAPDLLEPVRDAYLAAVAEHLAQMHGLDEPEWTERRGLDLTRPFFAGGLESLKARLLVESPAAFRRRMLFVGIDALSRPHADATSNNQDIGASP
jgi:hypothetical protein